MHRIAPPSACRESACRLKLSWKLAGLHRHRIVSLM